MQRKGEVEEEDEGMGSKTGREGRTEKRKKG